MKCALCGFDTQVYDSRARHGYVHRRRICMRCQHRFTTIEVLYVPNRVPRRVTAQRGGTRRDILEFFPTEAGGK